MTEQEHRAVLDAATVIAKRSFDDGVRAAVEMIRIVAAAADPPPSLEMVAKLIEATVTSDQA